jgi:NAD(P)-dependent dehydrogenase (short-subunit alcohol dehydrogenase family)
MTASIAALIDETGVVMLSYQAPAHLLKDKVILVTGAGDGIGRAAALSYAAHGARVILLGRTDTKLAVVAEQIEVNGGEPATRVAFDLQHASASAYHDLAATLTRHHGRLDGVLFNASLLGTLAPFGQIPEAEWDEVMQVNLKANFLLTQALLPLICATAKQYGDAAIIYTSSSVGRQGRAYWGSYAVSKFATEGMMEVLADELAHTSVRVNSLNPGATRTHMRASAFPAEDPLQLLTPAQLMPLYLYLMGPESGELRGQTINAQPKPAPAR